MSSDSATGNLEFPSLIGGVVLPFDFYPSIVFAGLFGLTIPLILWRIFTPRTRTFVLAGAIGYAFEHGILFVLRAHAARDESSSASKKLEAYFQMSLGAGFISIAMNLATLIRALLVNATYGTRPSPFNGRRGFPSSNTTIAAGYDAYGQPKADVEAFPLDGRSSTHLVAPQVDNVSVGVPLEGDLPRARWWIRKACLVAQLLCWASILLTTTSGIMFQTSDNPGEKANLIQLFRYAGSIVGLFIFFGLILGTVWGYRSLPRISPAPVICVFAVGGLVSVEIIYRLIAMRTSTTSIFSTAPGSLNSSQAKVLFYVFHVGPEFLAAAILASIDARNLFATGKWGDGGMGCFGRNKADE